MHLNFEKLIKKTIIPALIGLLLFYLGSCSQQKQELSDPEQLQVISVIDGDSLRVRYQNKEQSLRISYIDAPETSLNSKIYQDARRLGKDPEWIIRQGRSAKRYLQSLVSRGDILLFQPEQISQDRYGRLLASPRTPEGQLLSIAMVSAGFAEPFYKAPRTEEKQLVLNAFKSAKNKHRGMWAK